MSAVISVLRPNEILTGGRVKGGIIKAHLQWVRDYHGHDAISDVLEALPAEVAAEVNSAQAAGWCSFRSVVLLDRAIETLCGRGRRGFLRELGRYSAHVNLSKYREYRRDDLHQFFRRMQLLHRQFQDFGSVSYAQTSDGSGAMSHRDYGWFSRVYCESALGYYEQVIVMHGATPQLVIESSCQCAGDAACTFELSWE